MAGVDEAGGVGGEGRTGGRFGGSEAVSRAAAAVWRVQAR